MDFTVHVLHVKTGFEGREESIVRQFKESGLLFDWVAEYDIPEIDASVLNRYRNPEKSLRMTEISCCLKHKAAWRAIEASPAEGGLVFEDDVLLDGKNFVSYLNIALEEFTATGHETGCICLGDGCAMHVPWTKTRRGLHIYPAGRMRAADSYWISKQTASLLNRRVEEQGFALPSDHLLTQLLNELRIPVFWLEPTIVRQGSHNGVFASALQLNDEGLIRKRYEFRLKKIRRKYIYPLFGLDPRYK